MVLSLLASAIADTAAPADSTGITWLASPALVHRYRAHLPDRRVDLYAECVEVLLGHWDEVKEIKAPVPPGKSLKVLQPLALWMHAQKQADFDTLPGLLPLPKKTWKRGTWPCSWAKPTTGLSRSSGPVSMTKLPTSATPSLSHPLAHPSRQRRSQ